MENEAAGAVSYIFEVGVLKRIKRTGWWFTGVKEPESIAEHSHRTSVIGAMLAAAEGADVARVALLCTLHDTQETRTGDIPHIGRRYVKVESSNEDITSDQLGQASNKIAQVFRNAVEEYEQCETLEAIIAHDADKLECLIQAIEYQEHGHPTQQWIDNCQSKLKTDTARQWAETATT